MFSMAFGCLKNLRSGLSGCHKALQADRQYHQRLYISIMHSIEQITSTVEVKVRRSAYVEGTDGTYLDMGHTVGAPSNTRGEGDVERLSVARE
jgi:hypothetical protein